MTIQFQYCFSEKKQKWLILEVFFGVHWQIFTISDFEIWIEIDEIHIRRKHSNSYYSCSFNFHHLTYKFATRQFIVDGYVHYYVNIQLTPWKGINANEPIWWEKLTWNIYYLCLLPWLQFKVYCGNMDFDCLYIRTF